MVERELDYVLLFCLGVRFRRVSAKLLNGTRQQSSGLSQARQWGEVALRISAVFFMSGPVPGGGGCVVAYGRDACGSAVDCGDASIGTGLRVEAEVGPGGGAEILDRRFRLAMRRAICSWVALSCSATFASSRAICSWLALRCSISCFAVVRSRTIVSSNSASLGDGAASMGATSSGVVGAKGAGCGGAVFAAAA